MRVTARVPSQVLRDMSFLRTALGDHVKNVALFGSVLDKPYSMVGDVDVAVFLDGISLDAAAARLTPATTSLPLYICSANGGYKAPPRNLHLKGKYYHLVLLEADSPNPTFMRINAGKLLSI